LGPPPEEVSSNSQRKISKDEPLAEAVRNIVRKIDRRLALEDPARAARLMTAAFILTGMPFPKENLGSIYEGVKIMHESTAYDAIQDVARLERMADAILTAKSWEELLGTM
jgi:hypothetical protein